MKSFSNLVNAIFYLRDSVWFKPIPLTIENFTLDAPAHAIYVTYRMRSSRRLISQALHEFEFTHFASLSDYDQHRVTKFSALNAILKKLFINKQCSSDEFINFLGSEFHDDHRL